jgi:hypothetical protein
VPLLLFLKAIIGKLIPYKIEGFLFKTKRLLMHEVIMAMTVKMTDYWVF